MARSPLFDLYDPYGRLKAQADAGLLTDEEGQERQARIEDLLPEEEKTSLLRTLANAGTSGLAGAAYAFDYLGSGVRGLLAGKPASFMGTSDERVDGRDLLRAYGLIGDQDTWGNFAAGLATEIITDPLTYLNPFSLIGRGAASMAGRAAGRAGLLDNLAVLAKKKDMGVREFLTTHTGRDLVGMSPDSEAFVKFSNAARGKGLDTDELLNMPLAGAAEFRIPGLERGVMLGTGEGTQRVARVLDQFGEGLKYNPITAPVVNRITRAIDPTVLERLDPDDQWRAREAVAKFTDNERAVRQDAARMYLAARKAGDGFDDQAIQNAIRDTIEANGDPEIIAKLQDQASVAKIESIPEWREYRDWYRDTLAQAQERRAALGLETPNMQSLYGTGYMPRQAIRFAVDKSLDPDVPGKLGRRQRAYNRGAAIYGTDDLVGRGRRAYLDLERPSETMRRLMTGDLGTRLRDRLFGASPEQMPGILDEAFSTLGLESPYQRITVDGMSLDSIARNRTIADAADRLLGVPPPPPPGTALTTVLSPSAPTPSPAATKLDKFKASVQDAAARSGDTFPYDSLDDKSWRTLQSYMTNPQELPALRKRFDTTQAAIAQQQNAYKTQLADLLRGVDSQFAEKGLGYFDRHTLTDMLRYGAGGARTEANADVLLDSFIKHASDVPAESMPGGGAINLLSAAEQLGFQKGRLRELLQRRMPGRDVDQLSLPETALAEMKAVSAAQPASDSLLGDAYKSYTNLFKVGALANPSYHTRNLASGYLSTLMSGGFNPLGLARSMRAGYRAGKGDYDAVYELLKDAPAYQPLAGNKEEVIAKFLEESARAKLGQGFVTEGAADAAVGAPNLLPGMDTQVPGGRRYWTNLLYDPDRTWRDYMGIRGVDFAGAFSGRRAPSETTNPLLKLHELTGRRVEDSLRLGTFIDALRQGYSPDAAARQVMKTQVDYSPEAFTQLQKRIKDFVPFASYPMGIARGVGENMLYRPGGLQMQSIRSVAAGSRPSEENFTPEHLREAAAIPVPGGSEDLQRYLIFRALPYADLLNMVSFGGGATAAESVSDTVKKTSMNLLGQLSPVLKYPLESVLDRQFHSGRELSDAYSVLERDFGPLGRKAENIGYNLPFGSQAVGLYRTVTDDRLTPQQKAVKLLVNKVLGATVTDMDPEKMRQRAARQTLEELLSASPQVRSYESLSVPEKDLKSMPPDQQRLYLLYRVLQSEAARRARERKSAAEILTG
jgi:hypothetical protein